MTPTTIYTDGGCKPNPGPGGWGAVLLRGDGRGARVLRELSGFDPRTTNNRMEMTAALEALRLLDAGAAVDLVTDSTYLRNGITRWIEGWRKRDWLTLEGTPVLNQDLWRELDGEVRRVTVRWRWVKGHRGNRWNEHVDRLATLARKQRRNAPGPRPPGAGDPPATILPFVAAIPGVPSGTRAAPSPKAPVAPATAAPATAGISVVVAGTRGAWAGVVAVAGRETILGSRIEGASANRLYLHAALGVLETVPGDVPLTLATRSAYVVDGVARLPSWVARGWRLSTGKPVQNDDLWRALLEALRGRQVRVAMADAQADAPLLARTRALAQDAL